MIELDCLRETPDGEDLELVPSFRTAWREAITNQPDDLEGTVAGMLEVDGDVRVVEGERAVRVLQDGRVLAQWVSRPAMVADLAAFELLAARDDAWASRRPVERGRVTGALRLYLEQCPACGGPVTFDTDVTASCCNEYEVATVSCEDCGATVFETPVGEVRDAG